MDAIRYHAKYQEMKKKRNENIQEMMKIKGTMLHDIKKSNQSVMTKLKE